MDLLSGRLFSVIRDASLLVEVSLDNYELANESIEGVWSVSCKPRPDAYCDDIRKRHILPAMRSLDRAIPAAINIGQWLKWGMPERAGAFETELRAALHLLSSWVLHFPALVFYPVLKERRLEWKTNLDKVGGMSADLEHIAIESRDPGEWYQALHDALEATNIVRKSLDALYVAAEAASLDLVPQEKAAHAAIVSLKEVLARIGARFVYLLDDDEYAEALREHLPNWLFEEVRNLCWWGKQRRAPEKLDPVFRSRPPGTQVAKALRDLEGGISYLLDPPKPSVPQGKPPPRLNRRQRAPKTAQKDFEQAREDSIAEIIRSIARDGDIVTSGAVAARSKGQDGRSIPEGTIRNSKAWRNRGEITSEARGDTSYLDKYRGVDGFTSDGPFLDEQESEP